MTVPLIGDLQNCQNQWPSSFAKIRRLYNCSTSIPGPGAADPRAQALAPSLPIWFSLKSIFITVLLTFNASASASGQWQAMSNLRTYNTNMKPCPLPRSRVEVKVNFRQNKILLDTCVGKFFTSFTRVRTPSPISLSACFHPISMTLLERCTGLTLSNTTKVSQVSNASGTPLGTPLDSIFVHRFEAWSHRPPCQAPGLCSFIGNVIASQVDCRDSLVDF